MILRQSTAVRAGRVRFQSSPADSAERQAPPEDALNLEGA